MNKIDFSNKAKSGRSKDVTYEIEDCGCWKCTSHNHRKIDNRVRITINGRKDYLYRFVYAKFKGEIPEGLLVRHLCGNSYCINPEHLEVGTHEDNMIDMANHGSQKGELNPNSKLTENEVREIKKMIESDFKLETIAEKYNVSYKLISLIKRGKRWSHIEI